MSTFECPQCGHKAEAPASIQSAVVRCESCDQRVSFGVPVPRVVFSIAKDKRFMRLLVEDGIPGREARFHLQIDVPYARQLAQHILDTTEVPTQKADIVQQVATAVDLVERALAAAPTIAPSGE